MKYLNIGILFLRSLKLKKKEIANNWRGFSFFFRAFENSFVNFVFLIKVKVGVIQPYPVYRNVPYPVKQVVKVFF